MKIDDLTDKQKEKISAFGVNTWYVIEMLNEFEKSGKINHNWEEFFNSLNLLNKSDTTQKDTEYNKPIDELDFDKDELIPIRGSGVKIIENMKNSLNIPIATSLRTVPVRILEENRRIINKKIGDSKKRKVSYTHIIGWAIVKALKYYPSMNYAFKILNSQPYLIKQTDVNIGLAIDLIKKDGSRSLIVPNIKRANELTFKDFYDRYNDIIQRARSGRIEVSDFLNTTISLTNPGTIGTNSSSPRLMEGQGCIIATGSIDFPPGYEGANENIISMLGLSKVMNITSTYDHRIIQGAESGLFLKKINDLLLGSDSFYEEVFNDLEILMKPLLWSNDNFAKGDISGSNLKEIEKHTKVIQLINMYRVRGHLLSNLDPIQPKVQYNPELDPVNYGFTVWDYDRVFYCDGLGGYETAKLRDILNMLHETYCGTIGVEYRHIQDPEQKFWLQKNMEKIRNNPEWNSHIKKNTLLKLIQAELFEKYIDKKYLGHKRFSLEGSETLIPVLDYFLNEAANDSVKEVVFGMAHRGRLNVLANIIGKPLQVIFSKFEDILDVESTQGSGDVKYHLGASGIYSTYDKKEIKVTVVSNPSHLEFVNPVVEGIIRAKQVNFGDSQMEMFIPVLIHGDAAFAGEGIVAETLNLSQLAGYKTGGTIHIIVNNQIGFTTLPIDARSSLYASDVAKMVQAPIFHVNGDDPEACLWVTKLAYEYRMKFKRDVVIDIYSYRRLGHNETDEPAFTQPVLYEKIKKHPTVKNIYANKLIEEKTISKEDFKKIENDVLSLMDDNYLKIKKDTVTGDNEFKDIPYAIDIELINKTRNDSATCISFDNIKKIIGSLINIPEGFTLNEKLKKFINSRASFLDGNSKADWSLAEALSFGSLLLENIPVRLSGQDSSRGTFSHRHVVLTDFTNGNEIIPLNNMTENQEKIEPLDSLLSEAAVLGFEFGYSVADPHTLVLWEAQFGDFANAAQVIIDNFIVSSESKWKLPNHITMLLPHGQEGQGPEHSSARIERFLTLCADENMFVTLPSTPAQYFHLLRKQAKSSVRKPLIVFTPKSLLRHPEVKSSLIEFTDGKFFEIIDDTIYDKNSISKIILCSGKIYYDLSEYRRKNKINNCAIIRIEQLYPLNINKLQEIIGYYKSAEKIVVSQEEPANMGMQNYYKIRFEGLFPEFELKYVARDESPSPAPGSYSVYQDSQHRVIKDSFD